MLRTTARLFATAARRAPAPRTALSGARAMARTAKAAVADADDAKATGWGGAGWMASTVDEFHLCALAHAGFRARTTPRRARSRR